MASTPTDLVAEQDEYKNHVWEVCLWPAQWENFDAQLRLRWQSVDLDSSSRSTVPGEPGVYSLLVQPGIANHAECSYLMYIGKTINLRTRFGKYLTSEKSERGKIVRLLHRCEGYIQFCYSKVSQAKLAYVETQLFNAFVPPCNTQFTGKVGRAKGAFK